MVDDRQIIHTVSSGPPIGHSDHCIVNFSIFTCKRHETQTDWTSVTISEKSNVSKFAWRKADHDSISTYLQSIDWYQVICCNPSAKLSWLAFTSVVWDAVKMFVPEVNGATHKYRPKHYSREIHRLATKKRQAWRKLRLNPTDIKLRQHYRRCSNVLKNSCRDQIVKQETEIVNAKNLGTFYRFVNNRITYRTPIGALVDDDGTIVTDDAAKAALFNKCFASLGSVDDGKLPICNVKQCTALESVVFDESRVIAAINKLKNNLSAGPDALPPLFFKYHKYCLAKPLALLFTQMLSVGFVPSDWLRAIIIPVFKKSSAAIATNYRPISLTCVASKIMERIVAKALLEHLVENDLLSSAQHGFLKGKSTCTNLLESHNDWTLCLQNKHKSHCYLYRLQQSF